MAAFRGRLLRFCGPVSVVTIRDCRLMIACLYQGKGQKRGTRLDAPFLIGLEWVRLQELQRYKRDHHEE